MSILNRLNKDNQQPTVAVITATVGRDSLEKAIQSVQAQTYPCQHYVFVDGVVYWEKVKPLTEKYPMVNFSFLGMNTGRNKKYNGSINAILPYLIDEDIFCFLDDDNWHDNNHIEVLVNLMVKHQLDYAYSLRRMYSEAGEFLCDDNIESLGFWQLEQPAVAQHDGKMMRINNGRLIDVNCYAISRQVSFSLLNEWFVGWGNDRVVFDKLLALLLRGGCTGERTTNYCWSFKGNDGFSDEENCELFRQFQNNDTNLPWLTPTLLINGQLYPVTYS